MQIKPLEFAVLALAVWRVTSLIVLEDGPLGVFVRFRTLIGIIDDIQGNPTATNWFAELFACVWCLSVWVGISAWVLYLTWPRATMLVSVPLALSGAAIVVDGWTNGHS